MSVHLCKHLSYHCKNVYYYDMSNNIWGGKKKKKSDLRKNSDFEV